MKEPITGTWNTPCATVLYGNYTGKKTRKILQNKWSLREEDKDMIVMWHKFNFSQKGVDKEIRSHMVYIGKNNQFTAMSDTVGLPLGIAAKLLLSGKIKDRGVKLPIEREIYLPVLSELEQLGITFEEKEVPPVFYWISKLGISSFTFP